MKNHDAQQPDENMISRRDSLRQLAATGVGASLATSLEQQAKAAEPTTLGSQTDNASARNLITRENEKPGTKDWLLTKYRVEPKSKWRCPWVEGYASANRVKPGQSINFHISTNPASNVSIEIYRMGYYQGNGGRLMTKLGPFACKPQSDPPIGPERVRECQWDVTTAFTVPNDWLSGVYLAKLTEDREQLQSYIIFVVRDDRACDLLVQTSDNTWAAYNRWPDHFALYDDGKKEWYWGPDVRVSFDRPYGKYCQIFDAPLSLGSGEFLLWEFPLTFWLEQHGYDVSYISNIDTHEDPKTFARAKGLLSVGHDEYWSLEMFEHVKQAVQAGLNVAFLSANSICGVIDFHTSAAGGKNRSLSRVGQYGPIQETSVRSFPELKRLKKNGPNEATLMGARSTYPVTGGGDWTCRKEDHWLFANTGMKNGDSVKGIVGWEWHGDPIDIPGLEIVASGTTKNSAGVGGTYTSTIYPGPKGNWVFNAATIWWSDGLSAPPGYIHPSAHGAQPAGPDPRVQQITHNLLKKFLGK